MTGLERRWELDDSVVVARFGDRRAGDFHVDRDPAELAGRRATLAPHPWTWLRQVHGATVVVVDEPGSGAGREADASVTHRLDAVLAVQVADCAPVALVSAEGVVGIAHAGWRGVEAGVVGATVNAMRGLGAAEGLRAVVGPCIGPGQYRFGDDLLDGLEARFGPAARATTLDGRPALDLPAIVESALREAGVADIEFLGGCTAADPLRFYSHRARGDAERHAAVIWREPRERP